MNLNTSEAQPKFEPTKVVERVSRYLEDFYESSPRKQRLTEPQKLLLSYFLDGNSVSVCTEVGPSFGKITGHESYSGRFARKSLYELIIGELLECKTETIYGIEWKTYFISRYQSYSWRADL